jgi:hypothetical protein
VILKVRAMKTIKILMHKRGIKDNTTFIFCFTALCSLDQSNFGLYKSIINPVKETNKMLRTLVIMNIPIRKSSILKTIIKSGVKISKLMTPKNNPERILPCI